MYLIKGYANGFPDGQQRIFFVLDISSVQPAVWKVQQVTAPAASAVADLADLRIGGLTPFARLFRRDNDRLHRSHHKRNQYRDRNPRRRKRDG